MRPIATQIVGTGHYVPPFVLTNEMLSNMVDTNHEWIVRRTGVCQRRIAQGEGTADMAEKAARLALADSGIDPHLIDLILVATVTPDYFTPSVACTVQGRLGLNAPAFDISAACSGFVYGLDIADAYISSGKAKHVLLLTSETLSRIIDYTDRGTCILFGDGASGAVISQGEGEGILATFMAADGLGGQSLTAKALPDDENPLARTGQHHNRYLRMSGSDVLRFAVTAVPIAIDKALEKAGLTAADIDYFIPHQANLRIIDNIIARYGLDRDKVCVNLDSFGNTSSSSIGICLDRLRKEGAIHKGQTLLFVGFGGGLTYGAVIIKL